MKPFITLLFVAFTMPACATLQSATKSVDLPTECVDAADLIADAAPIIATKGGDELRAGLAEVVKGREDSAACAVSLYVAQRGGVDKLSDKERAAYDVAQAFLEARK
jgi:hypothetical protein